MFRVMGARSGRTDELDQFETQREASAMRLEYMQAFGPTWTIWTEETTEEVISPDYD